MTLNPGTKLGPYEIIVSIGPCGFGAVYRARDTRLKRSVGITVLPSNVMLTKSGAKLLDFRLAKLKQDAHPSSTLSEWPTNASMTAQGAILGTLLYTSPEQLEGQEADARSDIFAFGTLLYEMVTGR